MSGKLQNPFGSSHTQAPSAHPPSDETSSGRMFKILGYTPQEGPAGTVISVRVQCSLVRAETTFLRIIVGNSALSTTVRPSPSKQGNEWELEAVVPELEMMSSEVHGSSSRVPLTVQALNCSNVALDTLTFGEFSYARRCASSSPPLLCQQEVSDKLGCGPPSTSTAPDMDSVPSLSRKRHRKPAPKGSRPTSASVSKRTHLLNAAMAAHGGQEAQRQLKKQSLIRAPRSKSNGNKQHDTLRAVLQLETPTEPMALIDDWDVEECRMGRRIVRFTWVQDGYTLHVACQAIQPSEYTDGDTVVSCICRPPEVVEPGESPASQCCITSVDIIFLLERLVGDIFHIEEKNRIRRNLESFRPKTVFKNKVSTQEFFQTIMDFPVPKPRNIEKDVKVFDWAVLPQALGRVISKYMLPSGSKTESNCTISPKPQSSRAPSALPDPCIPAPHVPSSPSEHNPSTSPQQPDFHNEATYDTPQYAAGSSDSLDDNYIATTALSSADSYQSLLFQPRPPSDISSPDTTLCAPGGSSVPSNPVPISYVDSLDALYELPYSDQGALEWGSLYVPSYDWPDYQGIAMAWSPHPPPPQESQSFL